MKFVNLLIKPASSLCNLSCKYCFYADVAAKRAVRSYGIMQSETSERLIRIAFDQVHSNGTVSFAFQGGEPTLAGLDFYRKFIELETHYRKPGVNILHSIQTNGVGLGEEWAQFFSENDFLVGISIDGYKELHNLNRVDAIGNGTWTQVIKTLQLLQHNKVRTNILCVVTNVCAKRPQRVYNSLKKLNVGYLQFIPCLNPLETERGSLAYSLKPKDYGEFLCGLFDAWYRDWKKGQYISIRMFDDYVHLFMGMPSGTCAASGKCGTYFVVEGDGSLYPCDFYVLDHWRLGSVHENISLSKIAESEKFNTFRDQSLEKPSSCANCPWFSYCNAGCKRDWCMTEKGTQNYFCKSFQIFFTHTSSRLHEIAAAEWMIKVKYSL